MGTTAFEILIVPTLWATFDGCLAGIAILVLMNGVAALADRLGRPSQSPDMAPRSAHDSPRRARPPIARGAGSIG
jgi:hypothetical protein